LDIQSHAAPPAREPEPRPACSFPSICAQLHRGGSRPHSVTPSPECAFRFSQRHSLSRVRLPLLDPRIRHLGPPIWQGLSWIKTREEVNQLRVTTLIDKRFRTHLEDAMAFGQPLLIENLGEEMDPVRLPSRQPRTDGSTRELSDGVPCFLLCTNPSLPCTLCEPSEAPSCVEPRVPISAHLSHSLANVGWPQVLDPVLDKAVQKAGRGLKIVLSDKECEYSESFRLFLCSKLANPHFTPELCAQVTIQ